MKNLSNIGYTVLCFIFFPLLGLMLIFTGFFNQGVETRFVTEGRIADGTVISKFKSKGDPALTSSHLVPSSYWINFTFKDEKGRNFDSSSATSESTFNETTVGDHLEIKYLKDSPNNNQVMNDNDDVALEEMMPSLFMLAGLLFLAGPFLYQFGLPYVVRQFKSFKSPPKS